MRKHGLLLQRHTGRRRPRQHDGQVIAIRSNIRWCSDALEFTCWNGEVIRVAFALDCHDREVIGWLATTDGISGEMIRDMMVQCVERRFGTFHAPHRVQWLTDNGSIFAAHKTIEIAVALNLEPCFTPVESPESNGMAEAFVNGPHFGARNFPHLAGRRSAVWVISTSVFWRSPAALDRRGRRLRSAVATT